MYNAGQKIKFDTPNISNATKGIILAKFKVLDSLCANDINKTMYYVEYDEQYQPIFVLEDEIEGAL